MSEKRELSKDIQEMLFRLLRALCSEINLNEDSVRYPLKELRLIRLLYDGGYINIEHAKRLVHQNLICLGLSFLRYHDGSEIIPIQHLIGYTLKHAKEEEKKKIRFISPEVQNKYIAQAESVLEKAMEFLFEKPVPEHLARL